jgi:hypothetical protein
MTREKLMSALQTYIKTQDVISLVIIGTYCYMAIAQIPAPELLQTAVAAVLGYIYARATNGVAKARP